ncbi:AbrB/MazE/SpoVT family DNA-binding domain-containing protein [Cronbergia sp. UHCC 0137]|uniref:AbrB/MazE/SpoVT family DNA-binding domain-containing protein n=1 Tax=Cronbergia sp. UHCC 0137 TaxID=3110239 RepID=UPI002B20E112|nr:AbrB/MazE/SpoVT family DNA-binding domain-containing protein [Cronbergia sp. UHCC 0137]MEA5618278.1 AbrB/MazE/SpoVT family DNA-binding domain-containing protein [Cronbergia sp. UHCC 0137]
MKSVTVSPDIEIVIPSEICQFLNVAQGQKFRAERDGDRIILTLLKPINSMRGFLKGIDTTIERELDRV